MALDSDPYIDWRSRSDGTSHRLVKPEHFTRDPRKVRKAANMWALRHRMRCLSEIDPDGSAITVRFVERTGRV